MFNLPGAAAWLLILLATVVAGGLGSMARLALSHWHGKLPWGILVGNSVASLVAGFGFSLGSSSSYVGQQITALLMPLLSLGLAGGLSTFSSWAAQTVHYYRQGDNRLGTYNLLLNLVGPVACAILGVLLGGLLLK